MHSARDGTGRRFASPLGKSPGWRQNPALPIDGEAVLGAYQRGTLLSFVLLETAAVLGLLIALLAGRSSYGIILCGAALVGMLTRWPRETETDRLMRGKASP